MLLVAEAIAFDADGTLDVIREAESILVRALFDDLVRTISVTQRNTGTAAEGFTLEERAFLERVPVPDGGGKYTVFPWARSPPARSSF